MNAQNGHAEDDMSEVVYAKLITVRYGMSRSRLSPRITYTVLLLVTVSLTIY